MNTSLIYKTRIVIICFCLIVLAPFSACALKKEAQVITGDIIKQDTSEMNEVKMHKVTAENMTELLKHYALYKPGTIGSSLRWACIIYSLMEYSANYNIADLKCEELKQVIREAIFDLDYRTVLCLRALTGDTHSAKLLGLESEFVKENDCVDFCYDVDYVLLNFEEYKPLFGEIAAYDEMEVWVDSVKARDSWNTLKTALKEEILNY